MSGDDFVQGTRRARERERDAFGVLDKGRGGTGEERRRNASFGEGKEREEKLGTGPAVSFI